MINGFDGQAKSMQYTNWTVLIEFNSGGHNITAHSEKSTIMLLVYLQLKLATRVKKLSCEVK